MQVWQTALRLFVCLLVAYGKRDFPVSLPTTATQPHFRGFVICSLVVSVKQEPVLNGNCSHVY